MVVTAACLPVLCVLAAATIDVGHLCVTKAELQNAADAAAVAAVRQLWKSRTAAWDEITARADALAEGEAIAELNHGGVDTRVQFGTWNETAFQERSISVSVNAVRVTVFRNDTAAAGPTETFFAKVFGLNDVDQDATAVARFCPANSLIPFSIYEPEVVGPGDVLTLYDDTSPVVPGVFGLLDFNGGSNSTTELLDWVANGYQDAFWVDPESDGLVLQGNPGWVDAIKPAIQEHINVGDHVVACVYSDVWGTGAGTLFRVVGFIELVITAQGQDKRLDGTMRKWVEAEVQSRYIPGAGITEGTMRDFMKLQLVE